MDQATKDIAFRIATALGKLNTALLDATEAGCAVDIRLTTGTVPNTATPYTFVSFHRFTPPV